MTKEKWIGVYAYNATSTEDIPADAALLELHLETDAEGGITGHLVDGVYQTLTEVPVVIRGFIEENFLSLVAHYPFKMHRRENGEHYLDTESIDHEVPFYGELAEDGQKMIGSCEVIESVFISQDSVSDQLRVGFFKVRRAQ